MSDRTGFPNRNWIRLPVFTLAAALVIFAYQVVPLTITLDAGSVNRDLALALGLLVLLEIPVLLVLHATTPKTTQPTQRTVEATVTEGQSPDGTHDDSPTYRRSSLGIFVAGAAAGLLVAGVTVWSMSLFELPEPKLNPPVGAQAPSSPPATPTPGTNERRLAECRSVFDAQTQPLRVADASLSQWQIHVGAMNKLVVGAISLDQARAFWNQTRVGAKQLLRRYATAEHDFHQRRASCPTAPNHPAATLRTCAQAVAARNHELQLADIAIGTWRRHVRDMEMFRRGLMTPQQATTMWLRNWREGAQQLNQYQTAADAAQGQHC
jgi:hypothetical protein